MKDLRIEIRIKNNLLYQRIKEIFGSITMSEFAKRTGLNKNTLFALLAFRKSPVNRRTGKWTDMATTISNALETEPQLIFPEHLREIKGKLYRFEVDSQAYISAKEEQTPETILLQKEIGEPDVLIAEDIHSVLVTLQPREEKMIRCRFGLDQEPLRRSEIAHFFDISGTRVDQIMDKAFRKLRHPSRSKKLWRAKDLLQ